MLKKLYTIFKDNYKDFSININKKIDVNGVMTPELLSNGIVINNNFTVIEKFKKQNWCNSNNFC